VKSRKQRLRDLIEGRQWTRIGDAEWCEIEAAIPGVKPDDLQSLSIAVDPPWSGVRQHTFDELEVSLCGLSEVYGQRPDLARFCRAAVIAAKDRAKWAARSARVDPEKRKVKAEMAEWMLVWLGDPSVFPAWVPLRRAQMAAG